MRLAVCPILLLLLTGSLAGAQQGTPARRASVPDAAISELVRKQFGPGYTVLAEFTPMQADFDGDGTPDVAIPARVGNPLTQALEYHYKVVDPYDAYFGYGDPRVTQEFNVDDPRQKGLVVLIIHGSGSEGWRASVPKAKFVVINLPFTRLSLSRVQVKRNKTVAAVAADEADGVSSVIYWTGKTYKYEPNGASAE
jgi:hypothetical protein